MLVWDPSSEQSSFIRLKSLSFWALVEGGINRSLMNANQVHAEGRKCSYPARWSATKIQWDRFFLSKLTRDTTWIAQTQGRCYGIPVKTIDKQLTANQIVSKTILMSGLTMPLWGGNGKHYSLFSFQSQWNMYLFFLFIPICMFLITLLLPSHIHKDKGRELPKP